MRERLLGDARAARSAAIAGFFRTAFQWAASLPGRLMARTAPQASQVRLRR